jgi:predicted DNA-binding transcriptional regulator AlpA
MQDQNSTQSSAAWLSDRDLAKRYAVSRMTIWRWARSGHLPAPRKVGPNVTRWPAQAIEAHDASIAGEAA